MKRFTITTRRHGIWLTGAAIAVGLAVLVVTAVTTSQARTAVVPLLVIAGALHVCFLVIGSKRWMAAASGPLFGAIMLESGFSDEPSWVRAIVLGCGWFVALEMSWEAIERRSGARYTTAATLRRVQEVVTVVGIALVIGLIASAATSYAPARSVALQAVLLAGLLAAFVSVVRRAISSEPETTQL